MRPAPLDKHIIETLGRTFLKSSKASDGLRYRYASSHRAAQKIRADELGVRVDTLDGPIEAFIKHCNRVTMIPLHVRKLMRRGFPKDVAENMVDDWNSLQVLNPDREHIRKAARFNLEVIEGDIETRRQVLYAQRFTAAYPGRRRPSRWYKDFPVHVGFVAEKDRAGGYSHGSQRGRVKREDGSTSRSYSLRCELSVGAQCCKLIFSAGILKTKGCVTVWAEEITSPDVPSDLRAFMAVWVRSGKGFELKTQHGILIKTGRGALEYYEGKEMTLWAALRVRAKRQAMDAEKRAAAPKRFELKKARKTLAQKVGKGLDAGEPIADLFDEGGETFGLMF